MPTVLRAPHRLLSQGVLQSSPRRIARPVLLVATLALAALPAPAALASTAAPVAPSLRLSASGLIVGRQVSVVGVHLPADTAVTVTVSSSPPITLAHVTTNSGGSFAVRVPTPSVAPGVYVVAADINGAAVVSAAVPITVVTPPPKPPPAPRPAAPSTAASHASAQGSATAAPATSAPGAAVPPATSLPALSGSAHSANPVVLPQSSPAPTAPAVGFSSSAAATAPQAAGHVLKSPRAASSFGQPLQLDSAVKAGAALVLFAAAAVLLFLVRRRGQLSG